MNATAILVTRGDVDLTQIIASLPKVIDQVIIWDNSQREDLAVYGRYAAIAEARNDLIYVQDDDVLHTREGIEEIIRAHLPEGKLVIHDGPASYVTCNMPANFRHAFYQEHALVGFGACFHRDAPARAFNRFFVKEQPDRLLFGHDGATMVRVPQGDARRFDWINGEVFKRTCDIVFTALTPRVLVDVDYQDMPWASADNRMWKQSYHREERARMLEAVLKVRDAG